MENGKKIKLMDTENTNGLMEEFIWEIGKTIKCMDKVLTNGMVLF